MKNDINYIIRIKPTSVNQLYWNRVYYAKLKRNWSLGSKLIFLIKNPHSHEAFMGLGKIKNSHELQDLEASEKKMCTDNNYHAKIVFGTMVRFIPAVPIKYAKLLSFNKIDAPLLDGARISDSEVSSIESLARIVIIS